jgi:hypothetical protein
MVQSRSGVSTAARTDRKHLALGQQRRSWSIALSAGCLAKFQGAALHLISPNAILPRGRDGNAHSTASTEREVRGSGTLVPDAVKIYVCIL